MPSGGQHTVQKMLLSQFSSTPNLNYKRKRIWIHDKTREISYQNNINDPTKIQNFLSIDADDNITRLEKEIFPVLDRIQDSGLIYSRFYTDDISIQNLRYLYRYIAMQYVRTPFFRDVLNKNIQTYQGINMFLKEIHSGAFRKMSDSLGMIDFGFGRVDHTKFGHYAKAYYDYIIAKSEIELLGFDIFAASLNDITMPVVLVNKTQIPFLQNDLGLCPYFPLGNTRLNIKYFTHDGPKLDTLCVFPMDPSKIICLCTLKSYIEWADSIDPSENRGAILACSLESDIKKTNYYIHKFAVNEIYSNREFSEEFINQ